MPLMHKLEPAGWDRNWPVEQLTEFLDMISSAPDEGAAIRVAVSHACESFDADAAAILSPDGVIASAGIDDVDIPVEELEGLAEIGRGDLEIAGRGPCAVLAFPVGETERRHYLVVARSKASPFGGEEQDLLGGMARVLAMGLQLLRSISEERELRHRTETEVRVRHQAESDYRDLVELLPAIVYYCETGPEARWRYVSPQIKDILGWTPEEWLADPTLWARQLHPDDRERVFADEEERVRRNDSLTPIDYRMITRDGKVVWLLDEASQQRDGDGVPVWHGVLYDITARKRVEEELSHRARQQEAIAQLGERALEGVQPAALMESAVSLVAELEGADHACIWELSKDRRALRRRAGVGPDRRDPVRGATAPLDSHAGAALESGLHVIVDDWKTESRFSMPPALRGLGVRSSLAVVIDGRRSPFGVLDIHSAQPQRFTPQDVAFVQSAANVLADAIDRRAAEEELRRRVLHDSLTGLPNRALFLETIDEALDRAKEVGAPVGVLFLDLDHFKVINDSLGHHTGDELLRTIAPRLSEHLRPGDIVARFGGDEFGVLIEYLADEREAVAIAERVASAFEHPFKINGVEHWVSASVGIAVARPGDPLVGADSLIRDADAAMYRAKEKGRNRCELFDAEMRAGAVRRLETERELRQGLDDEQLVLQFQPIVALATGEVTALEALVRWQHPDRGLLSPGEFVPVAEDTGLISVIGRRVQESACRYAAQWHRERPDERPVDVSVNLSAREVAHGDLPAGIAAILERTGLDPAHLRLEITESVLVEETSAVAETLEALHELGVTLILDDFGTGYSSLAYLNRFPLDALKIDRSFIEGLGVEQERTAIVEAIVGMARALSLEVIAEGVENEVQYAELLRLGVDYAQGFYFSRPVAAHEVGALLDGGERPYSGIIPGR